MNPRSLALIALFIAAIIYGVTFTIAKEVMNNHIHPFGFIFIRVGGAMIIFWILGLFIKGEKSIEKTDFKKIGLAAFFGVGLNMLAFFKGLSFTTPISASVIMVTTPILVLIFSSIIINEKIPNYRITGVIIGLVGAVLLIVYGHVSEEKASNRALGNFLVFINAASYAMYLVLVKNLIVKYHPIIFVKWLYLAGFIFVFPFGISEFLNVSWQEMPSDIYLKAGFVVLFTTCITYLFNLFALSKLKPTTVSVFIYLQPVIATIYALIVGSDQLNFIKIIASILIFFGVFLVTKQPAITAN
jgi:drug/metabolite transporter (DMT)-like permease